MTDKQLERENWRMEAGEDRIEALRWEKVTQMNRREKINLWILRGLAAVAAITLIILVVSMR